MTHLHSSSRILSLAAAVALVIPLPEAAAQTVGNFSSLTTTGDTTVGGTLEVSRGGSLTPGFGLEVWGGIFARGRLSLSNEELADTQPGVTLELRSLSGQAYLTYLDGFNQGGQLTDQYYIFRLATDVSGTARRWVWKHDYLQPNSVTSYTQMEMGDGVLHLWGAPGAGVGTPGVGQYITLDANGPSISVGGQFVLTAASGLPLHPSSLAVGSGSTVIGQNGFAAGADASATGINASAFGLGTIAQGYNQLVIGQYNTLSGTSTANSNLTDALFIIGNGTGAATASRSNALVVQRNGNVGIGTTSPARRLTVSAAANDDGIRLINNTTGHTLVDLFRDGANNRGELRIYNGTSLGVLLAPYGSAKSSLAGSLAVGSNNGDSASKLSVSGNAAIGGSYFATAAPADGLIVAGSVGFGTNAPTAKTQVVGNATGDIFKVTTAASVANPGDAFTVKADGTILMRKQGDISMGEFGNP